MYFYTSSFETLYKSFLSCFLIQESLDTLLRSLFEFFVIDFHAGNLFVSGNLLVYGYAVGFHLFFHLLFGHPADIPEQSDLRLPREQRRRTCPNPSLDWLPSSSAGMFPEPTCRFFPVLSQRSRMAPTKGNFCAIISRMTANSTQWFF